MNIFKNDKTTVKDEIYLGLFILSFIVLGAIICYFKPSFFIISESTSLVFGILLIVIGVIFVPSLVYRLFTNDKR